MTILSSFLTIPHPPADAGVQIEKWSLYQEMQWLQFVKTIINSMR